MTSLRTFAFGPIAFASTILASSVGVSTGAHAGDAELTLDAYVALILDGPRARILDARAAEGAALKEGAGVWPNPALGLERQSGPFADQTDGSQDFAILEFPLVFPGRTSATHGAAAARGDAAAHERRGDLARLRFDATVLFVETVRLDRRVKALTDSRDRLAPIVDAARKRAEAGESAGGDRLRLEVELARLDDDVRLAQSDAFAAHRRAEVVAGATLPAFATAPPSLGAPAETKQPARADLDALTSRAQAAERDESAALLRLIPDAALAGGPVFLNSGSPDFGIGYVVSLRVELPLFDRGQGDGARARAEKARVEAERANLAARYSASLDIARRAAKERRERASLFARDVVPRADALFTSTSKAVEVGGDAAAVLALVDAARTLRETRTALIDLESDAALADAELLLTSGAWDAPKDATP